MSRKHVRVVIRTRPTTDFATDIIRMQPTNKVAYPRVTCLR